MAAFRQLLSFPAKCAILALAITWPTGPVEAVEAVELLERKIIKAGTSGDFKQFRRILVSPTVNPPEPFEGFGGFCGWPKICRLQNGDLFVGFGAGYWHASWPTPFEKHTSPRYAEYLYGKIGWLKKWNAPTGGRIMWIRSKDSGKTWSRPKSFPVVPGVYAPGTIAQLRDGTMLCAALIQLGYGYQRYLTPEPLEYARAVADRFPMKIVLFRSDDNGDTWREASRFPAPILFTGHVHTLIESPDGGVLMLVCGVPLSSGKEWGNKEERWVSAIVRSEDQGVTWNTISVFGSNDFDVEEGSLAYLPDGSIGTFSRCTSAWFQSYDHGHTWSEPRMLFAGASNAARALYIKGDLVVTADGITVAVFCAVASGLGGKGQVIYSRDSGKTWVMPAADRGFTFDPMSYYPQACVLADGSIFAVGDHQGFKNKFGPYGAEVPAMRFRIKTPHEGEGIELLPIGGPPVSAAKTTAGAAASANGVLDGGR
ncbi:MAG: sialidase family protein [Planctomycetota bacterium]|nr:sialidase family protein [Planctomycetota bacterium]